jgi:hypothetical protein
LTSIQTITQTVYALRALGYDVLRQQEDKGNGEEKYKKNGKAGIEYPDSEVLKSAASLDRVVLTCDIDYEDENKKNPNHFGIILCDDPARPKDEKLYGELALKIHSVAEKEQSLDGRLYGIRNKHLKTEEIEELKEIYKVELEKAKEEYRKQKAETEINRAEKLEKRKAQREQAIKEKEPRETDKKTQEKATEPEKKEKIERVFSSEELTVNRISENQFRVTLASGKSATTSSDNGGQLDADFLKDLEKRAYRDEIVQQIKQRKAGEKIIETKTETLIIEPTPEPKQQPIQQQPPKIKL